MPNEHDPNLISHRLLFATRAASIGIWDYDPINNSLVWDEQMFRIFRITEGQFTGTPEAWMATLHPDDLPLQIAKMQAAIETGEEFNSEFRIIWPDQSIRYIKANASVQHDETGRAINVIGTNWDITLQKTTEAQLARTVAELARSNADLAQFASIASHDLQEPLRAVSGCVESLAREYSGKLDAGADELIRHTLEGSRRMQALIHDLLSYSRIDTGGTIPALTNPNAALDVALDNLASLLGESSAIITREILPNVNANPTQLVQLFQNLISNSLKFFNGDRPEIQIRATQKDGVCIFSVSDNGIGIEPQYQERIFALFQRLHHRTAYPGTGIGLAICKRIVERYGGRIWLESELGKGTTFYFSLYDPSYLL